MGGVHDKEMKTLVVSHVETGHEEPQCLMGNDSNNENKAIWNEEHDWHLS